MKIPLFVLTLSVLFIFFSTSVTGREIVSFNDNWVFKKGPFPAEIKPDAPELAGEWEKVEIPHTWNADDMQNNKNDFYQGAAFTKKHTNQMKP